MMTPEEAKSVRTSEVWSYVCKEIDYRLSVLKDELLTCPPEHLEHIQLKARVLMDVKRMPDDAVDREEG